MFLHQSTQNFGNVKPDPYSMHSQNLKYVALKLLSREKGKVRWRFSTIGQIEPFLSTRKSQNTRFCPTPSFWTTLITFLGYCLICRMVLHYMASKFSEKCKNWGFWGMLPLVPNPAFGSFVKIVIWLCPSLKLKVFKLCTLEFENV